MECLAMKIKYREYILLLFVLLLSGYLLFKWTIGYTVSTLEDTRMIRAHQFIYSIKPYLTKPIEWFKDIAKNGIGVFSLGYILPAPLMLLLGDIAGFKITHILAALLTVFFIYLIIRKIFKYNIKTAWFSVLLLLTSYGFVYLSTYTTLDPIAFMFFFMFIYYYYKNNILVAGLTFLFALISKDPRVVLATAPGLLLFVFLFDRGKLKIKRNWFIVFGLLFIFLLIQKYLSGPNQVDAFPFGTAPNSDFFNTYKATFNFDHVYGALITAPVLVVVAVLGLANILKNQSLVQEKLIILCFIPLVWAYYSTCSCAPHYIYFTFPFLTLFAAKYINKNSFSNNLLFFILSLAFFIFSLAKPIYFTRLSLDEVSKLRQELLPYANKGYILSHGFDWGLYFHDRKWGNIWDWEWSDTADNIGILPSYVINNIGLICVNERNIDAFTNWPSAPNYQFIKIYKDWLFFIPSRQLKTSL